MGLGKYRVWESASEGKYINSRRRGLDFSLRHKGTWRRQKAMARLQTAYIPKASLRFFWAVLEPLYENLGGSDTLL